MDKGKGLDEINCESLDLRFDVAKDKFDSARFLKHVPRKNGSASCQTKQAGIDYHVHFQWNTGSKDEVSLFVSYHSPRVELNKGEKEPYAETIVSWLGQFFVNKTAHADVSAKFLYERESRFPLPIKLPIIPDIESQIDGISLELPSKPSGIEGILIINGSGRIHVHARAGSRIVFDEFDPIVLANTISSVVLKFTKAKTKEG